MNQLKQLKKTVLNYSNLKALLIIGLAISILLPLTQTPCLFGSQHQLSSGLAASSGSYDVFDHFDSYNSTTWSNATYNSPNFTWGCGTWEQQETWLYCEDMTGGSGTYNGHTFTHTLTTPYNGTFRIESELCWLGWSNSYKFQVFIRLLDASNNTVIVVGHNDTSSTGKGLKYAKIEDSSATTQAESGSHGYPDIIITRDIHQVKILWDGVLFDSGFSAKQITKIQLLIIGHNSTSYDEGSGGFNYLYALGPSSQNPLETPTTADSYTDSANERTNYNSTLRLDVKSGVSWDRRKSWLKFDIDDYQNVTQAYLYCYCISTFSNGHGTIKAYSTGTSWTENGIEDETAPQLGSLRDSDTGGGAGQWDRWNITNAITASTIAIALACDTGTDQGARYYTRHHGLSDNDPDKLELRPHLIVEYSYISIDIRSHNEGYQVKRYESTEVVAYVPGEPTTVKIQFDSGTEISMTQFQSSAIHTYTWAITQSVGDHNLTVKASDGSQTFSKTIEIEVVDEYLWELWFEIDYMEGFEPSTSALASWREFWRARAFNIHYDIDQEIPHESPINSDRIEELEYTYFNSTAAIHHNESNWHTSSTKWILWANASGINEAVGQCYVNISAVSGQDFNDDFLGGSYLVIYQGRIDALYSDSELNVQVIALIHETAHSIGIGYGEIFKVQSVEWLDEDYTNERLSQPTHCVMSEIVHSRILTGGRWYIDRAYWITRDVSSYET